MHSLQCWGINSRPAVSRPCDDGSTTIASATKITIILVEPDVQFPPCLCRRTIQVSPVPKERFQYTRGSLLLPRCRYSLLCRYQAILYQLELSSSPLRVTYQTIHVRYYIVLRAMEIAHRTWSAVPA